MNFRKPANTLGMPLLIAALLSVVGSVNAQTTAFTYQGKLVDSGNLASGQFDFQFKLFDTATVGTGTQQGSTVVVSSVQVTAGIFTLSLDFGVCATCFNGSSRFLEIAAKSTSNPTFTTLGPRQQLTSNPYAIRSLSSFSADGLTASCVSCITSGQIQSVNGNAITGTIPVASVPAGSANYIQNGTSQQASSNFNVSGDGTVGGTMTSNVFNAATQYNIGGLRILSNAGFLNLFVGQNAGQLNTSGQANTFVGVGAGTNTSVGNNNTFIGESAGASVLESNNTFLGFNAGSNQTLGNNNTAVGAEANVGSGSSLSFATALGSGALVQTSNTVVVGRSVDEVRVPGKMLLGTLSTAGSTTLCRNATNEIGTCSSSLRYKTNLQSFSRGLDLVQHLRPVSFNWKDEGMRDVGFAAEEVEAVEPLLTFRNEKGEIEGVKYDRLSVAFVNAINEEQAEIRERELQAADQQRQIEQYRVRLVTLQKEVESLRRVVCLGHSKTAACRKIKTAQ